VGRRRREEVEAESGFFLDYFGGRPCG